MGDGSPLPFQSHSPTSSDAALRAAPRAGTDRWIILSLLRSHPDGLTDEELQAMCGMQGSTERPRRVELLREGWIKDSGRTRKTRSGRQATVWVAI